MKRTQKFVTKYVNMFNDREEHHVKPHNLFISLVTSFFNFSKSYFQNVIFQNVHKSEKYFHYTCIIINYEPFR